MLALTVGCASAKVAGDSKACGPEITNLQRVTAAPMILLGEWHGITGPPAFAVDLACRLAAAGKPVLLALEIDHTEQERIDAFLASAGTPADRAALLEGRFWRREYQDGRSSEARAELLESVRRLRGQGKSLRVLAIDDAGPSGPKRDESMAARLLSARRPGETAIFLAGNLHVRKKPGAPWDRTVIWAGVKLHEQEPRLIALDNRFAPGDSWVCSGASVIDCGVQKVEGRGAAAGFGIEIFGATDEDGIDGVFDVGAAVASRPAVSK